MSQSAAPSFGFPAAPPVPAPPPRSAHRARGWVAALAVVAIGGAAAVVWWPNDGTTRSPSRERVVQDVEEPVDAPSVQPSPAPQRLPLADARLEGTYHVRMVLTQAYGWERLHAGTVMRGDWIVDARCASGSCNVVVRGDSSGGSWSMRLVRAGAAYRGTGRAPLSTCFMTSVTDDLSLRLRVGDARWRGDTWTAATFTGVFRDVSPAAASGLYTCQGSAFTASVTGTLRR